MLSILFSHFTKHTFHRIWKYIVFEESWKTFSCFWKVLIGNMILRITRCLGVLYHAWSSHQSLRTSTVRITALSKEKARKFYVFPFHWLYYTFQCWVVAVIELFLIMMNLNYKMLHKGVVLLNLPILFAFAQMSRAKGDFNTRQMLLGVQNGTKWSRGKMVTWHITRLINTIFILYNVKNDKLIQRHHLCRSYSPQVDPYLIFDIYRQNTWILWDEQTR